MYTLYRSLFKWFGWWNAASSHWSRMPHPPPIMCICICMKCIWMYLKEQKYTLSLHLLFLVSSPHSLTLTLALTLSIRHKWHCWDDTRGLKSVGYAIQNDKGKCREKGRMEWNGMECKCKKMEREREMVCGGGVVGCVW